MTPPIVAMVDAIASNDVARPKRGARLDMDCHSEGRGHRGGCVRAPREKEPQRGTCPTPRKTHSPCRATRRYQSAELGQRQGAANRPMTLGSIPTTRSRRLCPKPTRTTPGLWTTGRWGGPRMRPRLAGRRRRDGRGLGSTTTARSSPKPPTPPIPKGARAKRLCWWPKTITATRRAPSTSPRNSGDAASDNAPGFGDREQHHG